MQANSGDPDQQTPHSVASDLGLHCLPMSHKKDSRHIWVKNAIILLSHKSSRIFESRFTRNLLTCIQHFFHQDNGQYFIIHYLIP